MLARVEAAFFDLDKTVIARASMVAFGRPFYRQGLISRSLILRSLYAQLVYMHLGASEEKLARMRDSVLALTKGWERARVAEIVRETLDEVVQPIVYGEALALIEDHRAAGRAVYVISASPEEIVGPICEYLGVEDFIATRAKLDDDGRYTGETEFYAYGPNKAIAMHQIADERGIDLRASYAYSDSATDLPMLHAVGHPVVVNPDRELARAAREHGWEVRRFVRPVRLRDRVPMPPPGPSAAAVAGLAAGGAAWLWHHRSQRNRRHAPPPAGLTGLAARARSGATRSAASLRRLPRGR
jgi:HAD superfamily hydrolase (TIGR01490 family)